MGVIWNDIAKPAAVEREQVKKEIRIRRDDGLEIRTL